MVGRVEAGGDRHPRVRTDAPRAAVAHPRRRHRVLVMIAPRLRRKNALAIAEHDAVAIEAKRPAGVDQDEHFAGLPRKRGGG